MTFRQIVRILGSDIKGERRLGDGLRKVKGLGFVFSGAVCKISNIDINEQVGNLTDEQIKKITDIIKEPLKHGIPVWMLNRRKDRETGEDRHVVTSDLKFENEFDIKNLKKIKVYRGVRHSLGLPVRGQRTKAHFRHGKTVGVRKKSLVPAPKKERETK